MARKFSVLERFRRITRYRLVVPLRRGSHSPEHSARGVAVGLFWAFTPLVGIQMYLVFMTWLALRWTRRTNFNLVVGMAWTWVTNVFTMLPIYFGFYVTGQFMLGRWHDLSGYESFVNLFQQSFPADASTLEIVASYTAVIAKEQGLAMAVGCLPWAVLSAWFGYWWAVRIIARRRIKAQLRKAAKPPTVEIS